MALPLVVMQGIIMQSPLYIIWAAGIAMAWLHREEHPKVSMLVMLALTLLLVEAVAGSYLRLWLPVFLEQHPSSSSVRFIGSSLMNGSIGLAVHTIAWSLLLFATFNWRTNS